MEIVQLDADLLHGRSLGDGSSDAQSCGGAAQYNRLKCRRKQKNSSSVSQLLLLLQCVYFTHRLVMKIYDDVGLNGLYSIL